MKKLFIPFVLLLLLTDSCKKKEDNNGTTANTTVYKTYGSMDEIFDLLSLKPKVVTFDAAAGSKFYGNSGTLYVFQPNCFQDATGASVTGTVRLEVTEWLKKGDMIFSGMLPESNGESLISGGELSVKATQGGQEIFLKPGMALSASVPQNGTPEPGMQFYSGRPLTGNRASMVNWALRSDTFALGGLLYKGDTIQILSDSMNLFNIDKIKTTTGPQAIKLIMTAIGADIKTSSTIRAYCLFDGYRILIRPGIYYHDVIEPWGLKEAPVHFIAFGLINGHFYGGVVAATPKNGETYTVTLTEVKPEEFKAQLALYP